MKSYIEDIKFEIEVLISMLIWLTINFSAIKGEEVRGTLKLVLELKWREYVKGTYLTEEKFSKIQGF